MSLYLAPSIARLGLHLEITVPEDRLLARLGCPAGTEPSTTRLRRHVDEAIELIAEHAAPDAAYRPYPAEIQNGGVLVDSAIELDSRKLGRALMSCAGVCVFVVTLGIRVDRLLERMTREKIGFAVVLDAAAAVAVEALAGAFRSRLARNLPPGESLTLPFSPGYCDWPIGEQEKIFALLPSRPAGVALSADCLMTPRKSVSGVLGVGPRSEIEATGDPCRTCGRADCDYRRSPPGRIWKERAVPRHRGRARQARRSRESRLAPPGRTPDIPERGR